MKKQPDFIGIGAGRSGTNWITACLFEHPDVYVPMREINFFSRERNWSKGYDWYESLFQKSPVQARAGELSASYLADPETAERIHNRYPKAKLIVSLRHPVDRAFSHYINHIMAGKISPKTSFSEAVKVNHEYVEWGRYASHLKRFFHFFPKDQILVLIYENTFKNPRQAIKNICRFIGVDSDFEPSFLNKKVNVGRIPRSAYLGRFFIKSSGLLRRSRLRGLWWLMKKIGLIDTLLKFNTRNIKLELDPAERTMLDQIFQNEIKELESLLGYQILSWRK